MNTYLVTFSGPNPLRVYVNAKTYELARHNAARKAKRSARGIQTVSLVSYTPKP